MLRERDSPITGQKGERMREMGGRGGMFIQLDVYLDCSRGRGRKDNISKINRNWRNERIKRQIKSYQHTADF